MKAGELYDAVEARWPGVLKSPNHLKKKILQSALVNQYTTMEKKLKGQVTATAYNPPSDDTLGHHPSCVAESRPA